jgi:hypothetical protein
METLEVEVPTKGVRVPVAITLLFWLAKVTVPCGETVPKGAVTTASSVVAYPTCALLGANTVVPVDSAATLILVLPKLIALPSPEMVQTPAAEGLQATDP